LCTAKGVHLVLCGLDHQPMDMARRCGLLNLLGSGSMAPDLATGLAQARPVNLD
jgi:SulP family sulfate permease